MRHCQQADSHLMISHIASATFLWLPPKAGDQVRCAGKRTFVDRQTPSVSRSVDVQGDLICTKTVLMSSHRNGRMTGQQTCLAACS